MTSQDKGKRANGEGNVRQRKDGRWEVRVTDPATGQRRTAYYRSEAKARAELRRMVGRAEDGEVVLGSGAKLKAYGDAWLAGRAARGRTDSTVAIYRYRLTTYAWPYIGDIPVRQLTVVDVEDCLYALAERGLSASTVKGVKVALSALLTYARRARHVPVNVARDALLPEDAPRTTEAAVPTVEQVAALLDATAGTELGRLLALLALTGARVGEALGMTWADVDLEAGVWTVARTTTTAADGSKVLGRRTKTGDTRRVVLDPDAVQQLREQRAHVAAARLAARVWADPDPGLVWPTSVGTVVHDQNLRHQLRPIAARVGFPGSFHGLRHYWATQALGSAPLHVVSKTLGHRRVGITADTYAHLLDSDAGHAVTAVGDRLRLARGR